MTTCQKCKNKTCEYRNKSIINTTIFCAENCTALYINNARKYQKELETLAELENIAGFYGIAKQAKHLLNAANENFAQ